MAFAGAEDHPIVGYVGKWPTAGPVAVQAFASSDTTFVDGLNAALNISPFRLLRAHLMARSVPLDRSDPLPELHRRDGAPAGLPQGALHTGP